MNEHVGGAPGRAFTPYRVCPLGAHVDHQHGIITGFALDCGVTLDYSPTEDGQVAVTSQEFGGEARLSIRSPIPPRQGDWGDYLRGAAHVLMSGETLTRGITGQIAGSMPIGGLSSSAAVTLAYLQALCAVNGITPDAARLIHMAYLAETQYVGVNVGKLDQSCEVLCRKDHLMFLDTRTMAHECLPAPEDMRPFDIVIFYSGLSRTLSGTGFNDRVRQCHQAAARLKELSGAPHTGDGPARLREVSPEVFSEYGHRLPEAERKRAAHFYGEYDRVRRGVIAWKAGDIAAFGQLVFQSGMSSIENFEAGSEELIALYEALRDTKGVLGARFSGAGFKGCCVALVDPARREAASAAVTDQYLKRFPQHAGKYSVTCCGTRDGVMP